MKYFIGARIPNKYKTKIELLRAEFRFFSTEPHITLIAPTVLPHDDSFIKDIIKVCNETKSFNVKLGELEKFKSKVLYISVHSTEIQNLHNKLYEALHVENDKKSFTPHVTVVKQHPKQFLDFNNAERRAEKKLVQFPEFNLKSIVVYAQPKERSIYIPYMEIPLST